MIREIKSVQTKLEVVCLENLVPKDHLLRIIDRYIDFSFIREMVKPFYCEDNGRPGYDPVMIFKMLFIGYWYGIKSERQLEKEVQVNVAYRWFLGLSLTDDVPDHSTFSKLRCKKFKGSNIYQEIFDEIIFRAINLDMVKGKILYTDSTHIKANANKQKYTKKEVEKSTKWYLEELEDAVNETREKHEQKPLKKKKKSQNQKKSK